MMGTLCRECRVNKEAKHTKTVVDADEHHILSAPLLSVKLRFRTKALTIAASVNPQSHRQLRIDLARSLRPYIQIQAVLTEGSLLTIAPLGIIATRILDSLIARTAEGITYLHPLPGNDGLRFLPTVLPDRRSSVRNTTIDIHIRMVIGKDTLHLTSFDS